MLKKLKECLKKVKTVATMVQFEAHLFLQYALQSAQKTYTPGFLTFFNHTPQAAL